MSFLSKLFSKPVDERAIQAAQSWLVLCDAYDAEKSWEEASSIFKGAVDEQKWEKILHSSRKPLGELVTRKQISAETKKTMPGVPDGLYAIIRYSSQFTNKKETIETVTVFMDTDTVWRSCGYFLK